MGLMSSVISALTFQFSLKAVSCKSERKSIFNTEEKEQKEGKLLENACPGNPPSPSTHRVFLNLEK